MKTTERQYILIREADNRDIADIFYWRNDEYTRQMSHKTQLIDWEDHVVWFATSLAKENRLLLICEDEITVEKIAIVHFEVKINDALISINIAPKFRGKNRAKDCLRVAMSVLKSKFPRAETVRADILTGNIPSQKAFLGVGFEMKWQVNNTLVYEYIFR